MQTPETDAARLARSYLLQRHGMTILAAALPLALLISSLLGRTVFQPSISDYYWTLDPERTLLVGVLCSVAAFLFLYKGENRKEDRILDIAGLAAAGIAFFPTAGPGNAGDATASAHGVFAVLFFACIFTICIFRSEIYLKKNPDKEGSAHFQLLYRICSGVMLVSIAAAVILSFFPAEFIARLFRNHHLFWFEAVGIWSFSAFWYVRTREIDRSMSWIPFRRRKGA